MAEAFLRDAVCTPIGRSGSRPEPRPMYQLARSDRRSFLRTMCIGIGQGISLIIGNV